MSNIPMKAIIAFQNKIPPHFCEGTKVQINYFANFLTATVPAAAARRTPKPTKGRLSLVCGDVEEPLSAGLVVLGVSTTVVAGTVVGMTGAVGLLTVSAAKALNVENAAITTEAKIATNFFIINLLLKTHKLLKQL